MPAISDFFNLIFEPFRRLRSTIFNIQQIPTTIKGQIARGTAEAQGIKGEVKSYGQQAKAAAGKAKNAKAPNLKVPQVKKKMGLFSKKVACEGCGQKLHPSWDECSYCGFKKGQAPGAAAAAAGGGGGGAAAQVASGGGGGGGGPQRTMALDVGSVPG